MNGISVIICCYNSSQRLPTTLKYLANQIVDMKLKWEVIIVDNASTDQTCNVARSEWEKYQNNIILTIVKQPLEGLNNARQKGVETASYDYLIFCDDDNWLSSNYLNRAVELILCDRNENIAAWGGRADAVFEDSKLVPPWFDEYKSDYAIGEQNTQNGCVTKRGYLWGAGLILKKEIYLMIMNQKYPSFLVDRKGEELSSGGDSEICLRFILLGYDLYYDKNLFFYHYIPNTRLTQEYRIKLLAGFKASNQILNKYYCFIDEVCNNNPSIGKIKILLKYLLHILKFKKMTNYDRYVMSIFDFSAEKDKFFLLMWELYYLKR